MHKYFGWKCSLGFAKIKCWGVQPPREWPCHAIPWEPHDPSGQLAPSSAVASRGNPVRKGRRFGAGRSEGRAGSVHGSQVASAVDDGPGGMVGCDRGAALFAVAFLRASGGPRSAKTAATTARKRRSRERQVMLHLRAAYVSKPRFLRRRCNALPSQNGSPA